jgi:hypothetical protein
VYFDNTFPLNIDIFVFQTNSMIILFTLSNNFLKFKLFINDIKDFYIVHIKNNTSLYQFKLYIYIKKYNY